MRRSIPFLHLLAALAGCDESPGTIEGDAYLVLELGHERDLSGLRVRLVRDLPKFAELDSLLGQACPTRADPAATALRAPAQWERAWEERARILQPLAVGEAVTGSGARFRIDSIPPGRYRLWADTMVGERRWSWLVKMRVRAGDTTRVNLSNANPDENPFRCR